jgi:acylphosphatase
MKRAMIAIRGRVQGVFFRHTARVHAAGLGLAGWIKNEEDGSIAIVVEGEKEALEKFLAWCRKGPPLAAVENITITWNEPTGEFKKFEIL